MMRLHTWLCSHLILLTAADSELVIDVVADAVLKGGPEPWAARVQEASAGGVSAPVAVEPFLRVGCVLCGESCSALGCSAREPGDARRCAQQCLAHTAVAWNEECACCDGGLQAAVQDDFCESGGAAVLRAYDGVAAYSGAGAVLYRNRLCFL